MPLILRAVSLNDQPITQVMPQVGGQAILLRSAMYGTTAVLHDRFDAARVVAAIEDGEVSLVSLEFLLAMKPSCPTR